VNLTYLGKASRNGLPSLFTVDTPLCSQRFNINTPLASLTRDATDAILRGIAQSVVSAFPADPQPWLASVAPVEEDGWPPQEVESMCLVEPSNLLAVLVLDFSSGLPCIPGLYWLDFRSL
jgi:hypothetical protein